MMRTLLVLPLAALALAGCGANDDRPSASPATVTATVTVTASPTTEPIDDETCGVVYDKIDTTLKVVSTESISLDEFAAAMGASSDIRDLAGTTSSADLAAAMTSYADEVDAAAEAAADKTEFNTSDLVSAAEAIDSACTE